MKWIQLKQRVVLVLLAVGLMTLWHGYAVAEDLELRGVIINARWTNGDGFGTWAAVDVYNADPSFFDEVDYITITSPSGEQVLRQEQGDFDLTDYETYHEYWFDLPGSPEIGTYTFTIASGGNTWTGTDTQEQNRIIPYPDIHSFQVDGQTFSWDLVDYGEDIPLYYRFRLYDEDGNQLVNTGRILDMSSYTYEGQLDVGRRYRMQVRVCDSDSWYQVQNHSRGERWLTFGEPEPFDPVYEISGMVTGTDIAGMWINVYDWENGEHLGWTYVNESGIYSVKRLAPSPSGQYRVRLDSGDTYNVREDFPDPVVSGDVNVDFFPVQGGKIFGYVSATYGNFLQNMGVAAFDLSCGDWVNSVRTNDDGFYSVTAPVGTFALRVEPWWNGDLNYASEYYTASGGNAACDQAEGVNVALGADTRIDFELDPGGILAGHVMDEAGEPLADVHVYVELEPCSGKWLGGSNTNIDGDFEIKNLPLGTPLYVRICPSCSDQNNYSDEWYDGGDGTWHCDQVLGVEVMFQEVTRLNDTVLVSSQSLSGTVQGDNVAGIEVNVFDWESDEHIGGTMLTDNAFTVTGLMPPPSGQYRVRLESGDSFYVRYEHPDPVEPGAVDLDFIPEKGGRVFGYITGSGQPLQNVCVNADEINCGPWFSGCGTDENGYYSFALPVGSDYAIRADSLCNCENNFVPEYWTDSGGALGCNEAQAVTVELEQEIQIDFDLEPAGCVSGNIMYPSGLPASNIHVYVQTGPFEGAWLGGANTDDDGNFKIQGLPQGSVFVNICPSCAGQDQYLDMWYDGADGTMDPAQALGVRVLIGTDTVLNNLVLEDRSSGCSFNLSDTSIEINSRKNTIDVHVYTSEPDGWHIF